MSGTRRREVSRHALRHGEPIASVVTLYLLGVLESFKNSPHLLLLLKSMPFHGEGCGILAVMSETSEHTHSPPQTVSDDVQRTAITWGDVSTKTLAYNARTSNAFYDQDTRESNNESRLASGFQVKQLESQYLVDTAPCAPVALIYSSDMHTICKLNQILRQPNSDCGVCRPTSWASCCYQMSLVTSIPRFHWS